MTRDEILEKSRSENRKMDEREAQVYNEAGKKACGVGGLLCAAIILLNTLLDRYNSPATFAAWAVYLAITGTMLLVKYTHLKKRHELIAGALQLVLTAGFLAAYVVSLLR